jgi:hypothetical protein
MSGRPALALAIALVSCSAASPSTFPVADSTGEALTIVHGVDDATLDVLITPFGTNGRHCESCHGVLNGWVITPSDDQSRFTMGRKNAASPADGPPVDFADNASAIDNDELDPLFRAIDGATSPRADVSTPDSRPRAYALLLSRGLIRIGLPMPGSAELTLAAVDDPYGYASTSELSLFRRTLPMTNLAFEQTIMWDGREPSLRQQAVDATLGHAQASAPPSADALAQIVLSESSTLFAQDRDTDAGALSQDGALGGPAKLIEQTFYPGMNAFPGPDPRGAAFSPEVFTLYKAWIGSSNPRRASIARGEAIFNLWSFWITGVSGLNDELGQAAVRGTCSTCHNTPNVGTSSQGLLYDLGLSDSARRRADVPLYTFVHTATNERRLSTDPGQALITGRWNHLNRFKTPGLRGLAAHPPYFHDGSAATLSDVVDYLDSRFAIGLSLGDKQDLAAFLSSL